MIRISRKESPLTEAQVAKAAELIEKTAKSGNEHAFMICADSSSPGPTAKGDAAGVTPKSCSSGKSVGTFHTHPSGDIRPSGTDLVSAIEDKHETQCIGGIVEDQMVIQCLSFDRSVKGSEKIEDDLLDKAANAKGANKFRERGIWPFPLLTRATHERSLAAMDAQVETARRRGLITKKTYHLALRKKKMG